MTMGERIRQRRKELGMTQEILAASAGLSTAHIGLMEKDRIVNPGIATIELIAGALCESPSWIIWGGVR